MMSILVVHASPAALGGSEATILSSARALRDRGHRMLLVHADPELDPGVVDGAFDVVRGLPTIFERPGPKNVRQQAQERRALETLLSEESVDLIHAHLWRSWTLLRTLRRLRPMVATAHLPVCPNGARFRFTPELPCDRRVGPGCVTWGGRTQGCAHTADLESFGLPAMSVALLQTRAELLQIAQAAAIVAPSEWQRTRLVADGIPAARAHVVAPPIVASGRRNGGGEPPRVLVACRLARFKGVHHLLAASASATRPHVVDVVGSGPERVRLESQARELGIAERVVFHERLSSDATRQLMLAADVVVVPSLWPETFGMSGAEAAALGVPVVAYAHGGVLDWIGDSPANIAISTMAPRALAAGLDEVLGRGRVTGERVGGHDVERHVTQIEAVYAAALAEGDRP